jgi:branched-chain amino acid transport system permease protein
MDLILGVLANGVLMGAVYALIAFGLTIIFGVMRVVNFAHGEMVVIGMYAGYFLWAAFDWHPLLAVPAAALLLFVLGYLLQFHLVQHFLNRPAHVQFILFIALALVITGAHLVLFGPNPRGIFSLASFEVYAIGPLRLDAVRTQAAGAALLIVVLLWLFLAVSPLGLAIRAAADNRIGAAVVGIRIRHVYAVTAGIGMACAGAAGALVAPLFDTQPFLAPEFTLIAFITVILGGIGSLPGALLGGLLIGIAEAAAALVLAPSMKSVVSYALLILVMLARPQGLLGSTEGPQ